MPTFSPSTQPVPLGADNIDVSRAAQLFLGAAEGVAVQEGEQAADAKIGELLQEPAQVFTAKDLLSDDAGVRANAYNKRMESHLNSIAISQTKSRSVLAITNAQNDMNAIPLGGYVDLPDGTSVPANQRFMEREGALLSELGEISDNIQSSHLPADIKIDAMAELAGRRLGALATIAKTKADRGLALRLNQHQNDVEEVGSRNYQGGGVGEIEQFMAEVERLDSEAGYLNGAEAFNKFSQAERFRGSVSKQIVERDVPEQLQLARRDPDIIDAETFNYGEKRVIDVLAKKHAAEMQAAGASDAEIARGDSLIRGEAYKQNLSYLFKKAQSRDEELATIAAARAFSQQDDVPMSGPGLALFLNTVDELEGRIRQERTEKDSAAVSFVNGLLGDKPLDAPKGKMTADEINAYTAKQFEKYGIFKDKELGADPELQSKVAGILRGRILERQYGVERDIKAESTKQREAIDDAAAPYLKAINFKLDFEGKSKEQAQQLILDEVQRVGLLDDNFGGDPEVVNGVYRKIDNLFKGHELFQLLKQSGDGKTSAEREAESKLRRRKHTATILQDVINEGATVAAPQTPKTNEIPDFSILGGDRKNSAVREQGKIFGTNAFFHDAQAGNLFAEGLPGDAFDSWDDAASRPLLANTYYDTKAKMFRENADGLLYINKESVDILRKAGVGIVVKPGNEEYRFVVEAGIDGIEDGKDATPQRVAELGGAFIAAAETAGIAPSDAAGFIAGQPLYNVLYGSAPQAMREVIFGRKVSGQNEIRLASARLNYNEPDLNTTERGYFTRGSVIEQFDGARGQLGRISMERNNKSYELLWRAKLAKDLGTDYPAKYADDATDEGLRKSGARYLENYQDKFLTPDGQLIDIENIIADGNARAIVGDKLVKVPDADADPDAVLDAYEAGANIHILKKRIDGREVLLFALYAPVEQGQEPTYGQVDGWSNDKERRGKDTLYFVYQQER